MQSHHLLLPVRMLVVAVLLLLPVVRADCDAVTIFGLKTADCSRQNSKTIPRTLDGNIQVFRFDENRLAYLNDDEFSRYPNIQELYLARNRIEVISARALQGLFSLQVLDLDGNQLSDIPTNVLSTVPTLRMLRLSGNPIRQIHFGALKSLIHVEELNFENCWLTDIDPLAFDALSKLVEINLVNNELHTLSPNMERHLPRSLSIVRLYRNPWICDCRLRWLRRWTSQAKTSPSQSSINWDFFTNTPACAAPELIRGVAWKHLTPQQFACPSRIIASGNATETSMRVQPGQNTSLDCLASGDPEPSVEWSKGSTPLPEAFEGAPDVWSVELRVLPTTVEGDAGLISSRLNLFHIGAKQAGSYVCTASNSAGRSEVTYKLIIDVFDSARGLVSGGGHRPGEGLLIDRETIIGISIAMVVLLTVFILCTVLRMKKRNRHRREYKLKDYTDGTTPLKDAADGEVGEGGLRETGDEEKDSEEGNYTQIYKDWTSSMDRTTQTLLKDNGRVKSGAVVRNVGEQTQTSEEDISGASCVVQNGSSPNVIYSKCNRNRVGENQHALTNSIPQTLVESKRHSRIDGDEMPHDAVDIIVSGVGSKARDCFDPNEMEIGPSSSATSEESEYSQQENSVDLLSPNYNVGDQDAGQQHESTSTRDAPSYSEGHYRAGKRQPRTVSFSADTNKRLKKTQHGVTPLVTAASHGSSKPPNHIVSAIDPITKEESFSSTETLVIDDTISNTGGLLESFQSQQQQRERREQQQWERKEAQMQQRERQLLDRLQHPKGSSAGVDYRASNGACLDDPCAIPRPLPPQPMITIKMLPSAGSKEDRLPPPYHLHARDDKCLQYVSNNAKPALNYPQYSLKSQQPPSVESSEINDCQRRRLPTIPDQSQRWGYSRGRTQAATELPRGANANGGVPSVNHSNVNNTYNSLGRVRGTYASDGEDLISARNRIPSSSSLKYSFPHLHQNRTTSSANQRSRPTDAQGSHRQNQRQVAFPLERRRDELSSSITRDNYPSDDLNISRSKATDRSLFGGGVRNPPNIHSREKPKEVNPSQKKLLKINCSDSPSFTSNRQTTIEKCPITLLTDILSSPFDSASNDDSRTQAEHTTTTEWSSPDFSFDDDNTGTAL